MKNIPSIYLLLWDKSPPRPAHNNSLSLTVGWGGVELACGSRDHLEGPDRANIHDGSFTPKACPRLMWELT